MQVDLNNGHKTGGWVGCTVTHSQHPQLELKDFVEA